jgi:hypothetical protein
MVVNAYIEKIHNLNTVEKHVYDHIIIFMYVLYYLQFT